MAVEGNGNPEFRVDFSGQVFEEIADLKREAEERGAGLAFRSSWQQIVDRLKHDPKNFGEQIRKLDKMKLIVNVGSVYPLTVRFAYHQIQTLVYIMKAFLAPT
jgi:hypothetical protein